MFTMFKYKTNNQKIPIANMGNCVQVHIIYLGFVCKNMLFSTRLYVSTRILENVTAQKKRHLQSLRFWLVIRDMTKMKWLFKLSCSWKHDYWKFCSCSCCWGSGEVSVPTRFHQWVFLCWVPGNDLSRLHQDIFQDLDLLYHFVILYVQRVTMVF